MQRDLGPLEAEARRQVGENPLHGPNGLAGGEAWPCRALHFGGRKQIVARHAIGPGDLAERGDRAERHHVARGRAGPQVLHVAHREPERVVGLRGHPIGLPQDVEVVDIGRAHIGRERVEEARDRHAEHFGLGAIDVGIDLRRRGVEQREHLDQAGRLVGRPEDAADGLLERARSAAGAVLDVELEAAAGADAGNRRRRDHQHEGFAQRLHLATQVIENGVDPEPRLHSLLERLQGHKNDP